MSETMTRTEVEVLVYEITDDCIATEYPELPQRLVNHDAALRQEIERLTAERDDLLHNLDQCKGNEQATQRALAEQDRDEARSQRDFAKEDRDLFAERWHAVSQERDRLTEQLRLANIDQLQTQAELAHAEQERDHLRLALGRIANTAHSNYADNSSPYEIGVADGHRCAANWAQQALSQNPVKSQPATTEEATD